MFGDVSHVGPSLLVVLSTSLVVGTPRAVEGAIEVMEEVVSCGHDCKREVASRTRYHVVFRGLDEERGVRGGAHDSDSRDNLYQPTTRGVTRDARIQVRMYVGRIGRE